MNTKYNSELPGSVSLHPNCKFFSRRNIKTGNRISFVSEQGDFRYSQNEIGKTVEHSFGTDKK